MSETPLWRNRSFQFLWVGGTASDLGSSLTALALPLLILAVTGSPTLAGTAGTCLMASRMLLGLPAGVWVDRLDRRRILVTCETLRILAFTAFAGAVYWDVVTYWHVILLSLLHGGASAFFRPAHAATIQAVVPGHQLPTAYAQEQARSHAGTLAGPPLGGLLYTIAQALPFFLDALTYLFSLICVLAAKVPRRPAHTTTSSDPSPGSASRSKGTMRSDIAEALRWLWRQHGLRAALTLAVLSNVLLAAVMLPVIVLIDERGGGAITTGGVIAGIGVGGIVGSLMAGWIGRLIPAGPLVLVVHFMIAAALCAMTLPLGPWWPVVPLILAWLAVPAINVVISAMIGQLVPGQMMGRMHSLLEVATMGLTPIGPVVGGFIAAVLGGAGALLTIGTILLLTSMAAVASRALRNLGRSEESQKTAVQIDESTA